MMGHAHISLAGRARRIGAAALCLSLAAQAALAQDSTAWIEGMMNDACDPAVTSGMADGIRAQIEAHVARAEAAIEAPIPIGDLSCLNDLMNQDLDIFSNIGGILGSLSSGLNGSLSNPLNGVDVSGMICEFAAEKWAEVTEPLTGSLDDIMGDIPDIGGNFDVLNLNPRSNEPPPQNTGGGGGGGQAQADDEPPAALSPSGTNDTVQDIWNQLGQPSN